MGREIKRVPLDFDWPLDKTWDGFLSPDSLNGDPCPGCERGYSPHAEALFSQWYGYVPFDPASTGSTPFTEDTPEVRAFAERNVSNAPEYYGAGEAAIRREARRLIGLWNGQWSHHLAQQDVDALVAGGRLRDFTHTWSREAGFTLREPPYTPTAAEVNAWSLRGFGHDSINASVVIRARCEAEGAPVTCATCGGHGSVEAYPGQRAEAEAWEATEPPTGEGWQVWETVSEGSPITPVFATAEALIDYLATKGTVWDQKPTGDGPWRRSAAESFVGSGWAPSLVTTGGQVLTGGRDDDLIAQSAARSRAGEPRG